MALVKNQSAPWGDPLMFENPGDELYFGEVYRQVLQESWLPEGSEEWERVGQSRRGRRPTQMGITSPNLSRDQSEVRRCFAKCAAAWRDLPWDTPVDKFCDGRWGRDYWYKEKQDRGLMCSYYDVYMRYCLRFTLDTGCIPPANYLLKVEPVLTGVQCSKVYDLRFPNKCGDVSFVSGDGEFVAPGEWISPKWGTEGVLCFKDENGSLGSTTFRFTAPYWGDYISWPDTNPTEILFGESKAIYVEGGIPPYTWQVSGAGFTLASHITQGKSNTLIAAAWTDPAAKIMVLDICGNEVIGAVEAQPTNWHICTSGAQGGCCHPPSYPCKPGILWFGIYRKLTFDCSTRPGYGLDVVENVCQGVSMAAHASDCPQAGGKICDWGFWYWGGTEE